MAITTSAGDGVRVTSAAWCGVAVSGTATTVVVNGRWAVGCNQNNGNTAGCICGTCYAQFSNRVAVLRQGTCTEEIRFISSCTPICACDDTTLTVNQAWCTNPTACDAVHVSYLIQDASTVTGITQLNKRITDYGATRAFKVGNTGCAPAYALFAFVKGASLETTGCAMSNCSPDVTVENNGHFVNGYTANGVGIDGGYFVFPNATAGRCGVRIENGAKVDIIDNQEWFAVSNPENRLLGACTSGTAGLKVIRGVRQMDVTATGVCYTDIRLQGENNACDVLNVAGGLTMTNVEMVSMGPIRNINQNACAETMTFKNIIFAGNTGNIITLQGACTNNKDIILQNPKYTTDPPTSQITLLGAASTVQEQFIQTVTVQTPAGTKVACSIANHISTRCSTSAVRLTGSSNACGVVALNAEQRRWTGACETLATSTAHGLQVHDYCKTSFATVPSLTNKTDGFGQCLTVSIDTDPFIAGETECQAKTFTTQPTIIGPSTNPNSFIKFTGGCGTLTVGKWVGVCNGACAPTIYGKVKEINEGCSTSGTVILTDRSTGNFTTNLVEYECSACAPSSTKLDWTGSLTACSQKCFTYLYCVGAKTACLATTAQQAYNHQKAKLHECPIDTADNWDDAKIWGVGQHANFMQGVDSNACPKTFKTVRNTTTSEGWALTGLAGLGPIVEYTSDDGSVFTPQATVQIKVTVVEAEDFTTPVACARVHVENTAGTTEYLNTLTNACGIASACIIYTGDISVFVRARKEVEEYVKVPTTISSSGFDISIAVKDDPRYTPT